MKLKSLSLLLALFLPCTCVWSLETDDAYNHQSRAGQLFYKLDKSRDWRLTTADGISESELSQYDSNGDGTVSHEEFAANKEIPYDPWPGEVQRNIVYKRKDDRSLLLDVYRQGAAPTEKQPFLYYVHGGGWSGGHKEPGKHMTEVFERLTNSGIACVAVSYRLVRLGDKNDTVVIRDCAIDAKDGLRFIKKHADELMLDTDRVVVIGSSAGGHLTQLLTFCDADDFQGEADLAGYSVKPVGGVSWYGLADFTVDRLFESVDGAKLKEQFVPGFWQRLTVRSKEPLRYDQATPEQQEMYREISPVYYLEPNDPPLLAFHGTDDPVVSPNQLKYLKKVAEEKGANVETVMVQGANHSWWKPGMSPSWPEVRERTVEFVKQQIGN